MLLVIGLATLATHSAIRWRQLPPLPDPNGVVLPFVGVSSGELIVAGGTNFPNKKPWEGGKKRWYDEVYALDRESGRWQRIGHLPRPLGYGVSGTYRNKVVCAGGSDSDAVRTEAFCLEWTHGALRTTRLPSLPHPIENASGAIVGDKFYLVGGQQKADAATASNAVLRLDLAHLEKGWRAIAPIPGPGRILATAGAIDGSLYVVAGSELFADRGPSVGRRYLRDAYRFSASGGWQRLPDLPRAAVAACSPAPSDATGLFLFGGDDGAHVGFKPEARHPGFSRTVFKFDTRLVNWRSLPAAPLSRAGAAVTFWNGEWVFVSGEVRPGQRSPEVYSLKISG